jgi:hypothetical protein
MTCHRKPARGLSRRSWRLVCRAPRRIPAPGIINIASCLARHVGMDGGRCVWTNLMHTKGLRLEDEPIHAAEDPGMLPVKPRPFQRRGASVDIDHPLVHRPAMPLFPDPRRNMVTDDGGADPWGACRRIVDRLRADACGHRVRVGIGAGLERRSDDVLHALSRSGLCHRAVPPVIQPGLRRTRRLRRQHFAERERWVSSSIGAADMAMVPHQSPHTNPRRRACRPHGPSQATAFGGIQVSRRNSPQTVKADKAYFLYVRFYGSQPPFFVKTWKLPDLEPVQ